MKSRILLRSLLVTGFGVCSSFGQLFVEGSFTGPTEPAANISIVNGAPGTSTTLSYATGNLGNGNTHRVSFAERAGAPVDFVPLTSIQVGSVGYSNKSVLTASSPTADLQLTLTFNGGITVVLSPITFSLDSAANLGDNVFGVTFATRTGEVSIGGQGYKYDLIGAGFTSYSLAEGGFNSGTPLAAYVYFTPIPEPSTYGAIAAVGLVGLIAYRRRNKSVVADKVS